jgi:hypothetical protein
VTNVSRTDSSEIEARGGWSRRCHLEHGSDPTGILLGPFIVGAFRTRGFRPVRAQNGIASASVAAFACRIERHPFAALLRIPRFAVLTSDVSQSAVGVAQTGNWFGSDRPAPTRPGVVGGAYSKCCQTADEGVLELAPVDPRRSGAPGALTNVDGSSCAAPDRSAGNANLVLRVRNIPT